MGWSSCLSVLLISALLLLLLPPFSHGLGRKVMQTFGKEEESAFLSEGNARLSREMYDGSDYEDPGPNTNTKSGFLPNVPAHSHGHHPVLAPPAPSPGY